MSTMFSTNVPHQDGLFRITVAGPAFPGLKVQSQNLIRVESGQTEASPFLTLRLLDSSVKATGPKFLVKIFLASQENLSMKSLNTITVSKIPLNNEMEGDNQRYEFKSECSLNLDTTLPSWVPSIGTIERRGSRAFQSMLDKDVGRLVESFRNEFNDWQVEEIEPEEHGVVCLKTRNTHRKF